MFDKYYAARLPPQESHYAVLAATRAPGYFDELFARLPPSADRVLDMGSGPGMITLQIAGRARFIVGLDRSVDLVNLAQALARERGTTNVAWVVGDMEQPPFPAECFDLVVSTNALRGTLIRRALPRFARLVKPGGRLAVKSVGAARPRPPVFVLLGHIRRTPGVARVHASVLGLGSALRYVVYRLSPRTLASLVLVRAVWGKELEQTYRETMPGCTMKMDRGNYVVGWMKPEEGQRSM